MAASLRKFGFVSVPEVGGGGPQLQQRGIQGLSFLFVGFRVGGEGLRFNSNLSEASMYIYLRDF
jgi:hypothetical protein